MMKLSTRIVLLASSAVMLTGSPLLVDAQQGSTFDRRVAPEALPAKPLVFPKAEIRKLDNGIEVAILVDRSSPVVRVSTLIEVSSQLDPEGKTGLSSIVPSMLSEGTVRHTADQLSDEFAKLGNSVSPFGFYTITANVDRSLELMAEQLFEPAFPEASLERIKSSTIAQLSRSLENPSYLASRVFNNVLYGKDHPYSRSATETTISSISRDDVVNFFNAYYRPPNVKFVIGGDISADEAVARLNAIFGKWEAGQPGRVIPEEPHGVDSTVIYLFDRPNSPQSVIRVGFPGPRRNTPDYYALELLNKTFGGAFTSRLNLNLRELHQYSYGAGSRFVYRKMPEVGEFFATSSVVSSKTDSALIEFVKELRGVSGEHPITADEFEFAQAQAINVLPLQFETVRDRVDAIAGLVRNDLPLDYYNGLVQSYNAVTLQDVLRVSKEYIKPDKVVIVVVGDRKQIEQSIRDANIAPIVVVETLD